MTATLSDEDLAILEKEGCLVDAEAAAIRAWDESTPPGMIPRPMSDLGNAACRRQVERAASILRAAGLEPGGPSLDLLVAAIERREWGYLLGDGAEGRHGNRWAVVYRDAPHWAGPFRKEASGSGPATALALAFCQAIRATTAPGRDGGGAG